MRKSRGKVSDVSEQGKMEALRKAVLNSNFEQVQELLNGGVDLNAMRKDDKLLHVAVQEDDIKIMALLIHYNADVSLSNKDGNTPLHLAQSVEVAQKLIENNADVNVMNEFNLTPVHLVRTAEVAQKLIENNANINAQSAKGNTPLHLARNVEVVQKLIENNANINAPSAQGETPIDRYLMSPFPTLDCLFLYAKLVLSGQAIFSKHCAIDKLQKIINCNKTESVIKQKQLAVVLKAFAADQVESLLIPDQIQNLMQEDWQLLGCEEE